MAPKRTKKAHTTPAATDAAAGAGVGSKPSVARDKGGQDSVPEWLRKVFAREEKLETHHLPAAAPDPKALAGEEEGTEPPQAAAATTRASGRKRTKGKDTKGPTRAASRTKRAKTSAGTSDKPSTRGQKSKTETEEKEKKEKKGKKGVSEEGESGGESETGSILESEDEQRRLQRAMKEPIETMEVQPTSGARGLEFEVKGSRGKVYKVTIARNPTCTCRDFLVRKPACKHILHVLMKELHVPLDHQMFTRGENNVVVEGKEMREFVKVVAGEKSRAEKEE